MKKIFLVCATLLLGVIQPNIGFAEFFTDASGSVSTTIPVTGRIDNATQSWSGSLITNFDADGAPVITSVTTQEMYFDNLAGSFSGFFVLTAACSTVDCKKPSTSNWDESAFVSFSHGVSGFEAKFGAPTGDVYPMVGFAWSKSSGWIAFSVGSDPVKYNRATGLFSGYAWSKNLGYISMNGLKMWTKAPNLNITDDIMLVNHDQTLGTGALGNLDGLEPYKLRFSVTVPKDSTGQSQIEWTGAVANFDHVDLRLPGTYHYDYTDPFGNNTTGDLQVLTDKPTNTLYNGTPSPLLTITQTSTPANGSSIGQIKIDLHDKYGNAIKDVAHFKKVQFTVNIKNTISPNQTQFDAIDGLTIDKGCPQYGLSIVPSGSLFNGGLSSEYTKSVCPLIPYTSSGYTNTYPNSSGGILDIASYMPTDSDNKLEVVEVLYTITSDYTQDLNKNVGQDEGDLTTTLPVTENKYMSFDKLGSANFYLQNGTIGRFGLGLPFDTRSDWSTVPSVFSDNKFYHLYTTQTGSVNLGLALSFSGISTGATVIDLYSSLSTQPVWRFIQKNPQVSADNLFSLIPEVLGSSLSQIDFDLQHQVVHTFNNGSNDFAYVFGGAAGTGVTQNRGIKIIGTASTSNSGSIFALNTQDEYTKVGNFSKPQVKDFVRQNVEAIIRNPSTDALVKDNVPFDLNSTDSSWQSKQTIIVRGEDLTISTDVPVLGNGKPRAIIVIGGDIKIGPDVKNIYASIFTDKGLYAVKTDGNLIDDSSRSNNQLYIFGTLISGNTVGTSAQSANGGACPDFLPKTCSPDQKKQYDLNFLRTGPSPGNVSVSEYPEYPVVIRYNPKLTSDPPPGFKKIAR